MFHFDNPFAFLLNFFADLLNHDFGLSIIIITILIRILLMPLFIKQEKQQKETQEKIEKVKPELTKIQEKMGKATTTEERLKIQKEMKSLYKDNGISILSMGFLPALIQAPILIAFYHTLTQSEILTNQSFLWFSLSSPDFFLSIFLGLCYFFQFKIVEMINSHNSSKSNPLSFLTYAFPLLMMGISLKIASAIVLYWLIGCLFMILYKTVQLIRLKKHS